MSLIKVECILAGWYSHIRSYYCVVFLPYRGDLYFSCPQQPDLKVPLSRVHDGICDCCDGVDEPAAADCPDRCQELLLAAREAAAEQLAHFQQGAQLRMADLQAYQTIQKETTEKLEKAAADKFFIQQEVQRVGQLAKDIRLGLYADRSTTVLKRTLATATMVPTADHLALQQEGRGWLEALTIDELVWMTVHACQVAGELAEAADDNSARLTTCAPLRLAGLDAGMLWETGTYQFVNVPADDAAGQERLSEWLVHNMRHDQKRWSDSGNTHSGKRRRLTEELDEYMDDDYGYMDDEEEFDEEEYYKERYGDAAGDNDGGSEAQESSGAKREELYNLITAKPFSVDRVNFLGRSKQILERIEALQKAAEEESEAEDVDEDKSDDRVDDKKDSSKTETPVDPMALPMIKNQLERREKVIRRGFDYAISAKVLLDAMESEIGQDEESFRFLLYPLVIGTLNHGNLSLFQFWQILYNLLPEFELDAQTCRSSPLSGYCPPQSMQRNAKQVPPPGILRALEEWCTHKLNESSFATPGMCMAQDDDDDDVTIPSDIPDGFAGYFEVEPRDKSDFFHSIFEDLRLEGNEEGLSALSELEQELQKLEKDEKELEKSIEEMTTVMGGENGDAYGPDGELYALRDSCHNIEAGKYTYEVCLFGAASQKEGAGRGTDLGKWTGARFDDNDGRRVWTWENGAKCWNGPQRSATVYVTCGQENRIVSAEEPDTCRYVLEMESYIACDEAYRDRHNLQTQVESKK